MKPLAFANNLLTQPLHFLKDLIRVHCIRINYYRVVSCTQWRDIARRIDSVAFDHVVQNIVVIRFAAACFDLVGAPAGAFLRRGIEIDF